MMPVLWTKGGEGMPEDRLRRSMLLDYYGELLTPRQRECYELHYNDDLSLSEIAEQCGISRQGAWDNIRRAGEALEEMEEKTGLIRRLSETERHLRHLQHLLKEMKARSAGREDLDALLQEAEQEVTGLLKTSDGDETDGI